MEIKGKLVKIMPPMTGQGKAGEWKKQEFILEVQDGQYPKKLCISTWGDKVNVDELINKSIMVEGNILNVFFDIESREYQGKWFTNLTAWKVELSDDGRKSEPLMPPPEEYVPEYIPDSEQPF